MRFLKGLIYTAIGFIISIYHQDLIDGFEKFFFNQGYTYAESSNIAGWIFVPIGLWAVVWMFFRGIYIMMTHQSGPLPMFTSRKAGYASPGDSQSSKYQGLGNVKTVLDYRDATMGTIGNKDGVELFAKTAWVDGVIANNGSQENTKFTLSYLDAKLGTMGNKEALEWLKSGGK